MRLLVDQNLPFRICDLLAPAGHDVVHVQSVSMDRADDAEILEYAARERRIVISSDTDFGALLAASRASGPSVVLTREVSTFPAASWRDCWWPTFRPSPTPSKRARSSR